MNIFKVITRKKVINLEINEKTELARVLTSCDLTFLGVSSTLGVGIYVLAGHVARDIAGPAIILSFIIAAIASVLAGLCYAEFGARVPKAGSAYIYSYVCIGELVAFIIGWSLILEYVIGSASVARSLSLYVDTLTNTVMQTTFRNLAPIHVNFLSEYFDFLAFGLCFLFSVALAFGMKESSRINNICTLLNLFVVLFVIIAGSTQAKWENWNLPAAKNHFGKGGFFPYGLSGMLKGAAVCFYGFIGFDCIATTGEEVQNPRKAIPSSIIISLFIIFLSYFGTSTVLTLMIPYSMQDINAPIPHAFVMVGWNWAKWVIAFGAICGLVTSLFGSMFPLPRIIYAMAGDGLIFKSLGKVSPKFHTPLFGTLLAGVLTGLMAALFELDQLVNMMSIATLLAYTIVAVSILLLRYSKIDDGQQALLPSKLSEIDERTPLHDCGNIRITYNTEANCHQVEEFSVVSQIFNLQNFRTPTKFSETLVTVLVCFYCLLCIVLGFSTIHLHEKLLELNLLACGWNVGIVITMVFCLVLISKQPASRLETNFKVPWVPLLPALSILINIYLMLMLDFHTWVRLGIWMIVGLVIYGCYGIPNSIKKLNEYERID